jgi:hypothetical protein
MAGEQLIEAERTELIVGVFTLRGHRRKRRRAWCCTTAPCPCRKRQTAVQRLRHAPVQPAEGIRQEQHHFEGRQYRRPVRQPILKRTHVAQGGGAKGGGGGMHDTRAARHLAAIVSATNDADVPVRTSH